MTTSPELAEAEYILPLRWSEDGRLEELTDYLRVLSGWIRITVVDGSPPEVFEAHRRAWQGLVRHIRPEPGHGRNGKPAHRHPMCGAEQDHARYPVAGWREQPVCVRRDGT